MFKVGDEVYIKNQEFKGVRKITEIFEYKILSTIYVLNHRNAFTEENLIRKEKWDYEQDFDKLIEGE